MRTRTITAAAAAALLAGATTAGWVGAQPIDSRNTMSAPPEVVEILPSRPYTGTYLYLYGTQEPTPADTSHATGRVDSDTPGAPFSGSGVQAGNMGPGNSKGQ